VEVEVLKSTQDEIERFAYVITLRLKGKQTNILKFTVLWGIGHLIPKKLTDISEVLTAFIFRVVEVVSTAETWAHFYETTRSNMPGSCDFHICRHEDLKSEVLI
jgi:hypothetical protein